MKNLHQIYVRYAETDKMGVVYHSNYFLYFEEGRNNLMRSIDFSLAKLEKDYNVFFPVVDCYAKFFSSAHYDELITVETVLSFNEGLVFTFENAIYKDNIKLCSGWTKHCFVNQQTNRPIKPPSEFLKAIRIDFT